MKKNPGTGTRGRPRQFDPETALDRAMAVFWEKGYQGTSIEDLTAAMGINRPSLYAAFGDKDSLYRKALDRYASGPAAYVAEALAAPTARETAERLLRGAQNLHAGPGMPKGCLVVHGALSCGDGENAAGRELSGRRAQILEGIEKRMEAARASGELPVGTDPRQLALYLSAVISGMAVLAFGGASNEELGGVVDITLAAWPGADSPATRRE